MYTTVYSWVQLCTSDSTKNCAWMLKKMQGKVIVWVKRKKDNNVKGKL